MSMLNQSGEEPVECPLCMEPLEVDDLNFFPCTCGYQICRFCWHRIRTDENGLCPACRKAYPEDPADFKPLSKEDFARIKAEKRQKNQQKKQKITENRKSLGNVRVVQKNLVFVLGLPTRLADAETLKKHEYFGKFGKILKVVVNQSTAYAGNQGPCASAYVTYSRSEDALRAIQAVNNVSVDGRIIKTSLGTTKYCSHFMKNQSCPKTDCMYLHEMGDPEASFTKEEMQQGKHQEFEKKLHDQLINSTQPPLCPTSQKQFSVFPRKPSPSPPSVQLNQYSSSDNSPTLQNASSSTPSSSSDRTSPTMLGSCNTASQACPNISMTAKEEWPSLRPYSPTELSYTDSANDPKEGNSDNLSDQSDCGETVSESYDKTHKKRTKKRNTQTDDREPEEQDTTIFSDTSDSSETNETQTSDALQSVLIENHCNSDIAQFSIHLGNSPDVHLEELQTLDEQQQPNLSPSSPTVSSAVFGNVDTDNNSFFSLNNFHSNSNGTTNIAPQNEWLFNGEPHMPDVLPPVQSNEDWQAAFGFATGHHNHNVQNNVELRVSEKPVTKCEDELGFDPFVETQKALAELMETEKNCGYYDHHHQHHNHHGSGINNNNNIHSNNSHQHTNHHHHNHHQNSNSRDSNSLLNNNNNSVYQKRFITMQQNNRLANCTKLLDELRIGSVIPPRTHVPPPGFSNTPNHMNAFGLGIPRTGNKVLPFAQQTLTAFQQHSTPTNWDWSSIDPAIVTTGQHCDLYASQPPPGFTLTPTIDSKYMFNNFI